MIKVDPKKFYKDNEDRYATEKRAAFLDEAMLGVVGYLDNLDLNEETPSFADLSEEFLEEFEFPEIDKWLGDEYESVLDELGDIERDLKDDR